MSRRNPSTSKAPDARCAGPVTMEQEGMNSRMRSYAAGFLGATLAACFGLATLVVDPGPAGADDRVVTILVVGDTGFNRNRQKVLPDRVMSKAGPLSWSQTTAGIADRMTRIHLEDALVRIGKSLGS